MDYFFDSSALVKRYVPEAGSSWVRGITSAPADHIVIAQITPAEVMSGVSRRVRENAITPQTAQAVRHLLDAHTYRDYEVIELSRRIVQRAEDFLQTHPLRAYDAIQLASAIEAQLLLVKAAMRAPIFVSADQRLLSVAQLVGLNTDNPNNYP